MELILLAIGLMQQQWQSIYIEKNGDKNITQIGDKNKKASCSLANAKWC